MRRVLIALPMTAAGVLLLGAAMPAAARAPRYAVVNVGPADHGTTQQILRIYELLSPKPRLTPPPPRRVAPRVAPRRVVARPAGGARRAAARPRPAGLSAPIRGQALRQALAGLSRDQAQARADAALQLGKRLFSTLKRAQATVALAKAIALYDEHVPWKRARAALVEACTYLLLCHHALGQQVAARRVAARLRELSGDRLPPGVPPGIWAAYPTEPMPLGPRRTIDVKAPPKARVFLDDHPVGRGPRRLTVGPGPHRVRVEQPGHHVQQVVVAAGRTDQTLLAALVPRPTDAFGDIRAELSKARRSADRWATPVLRTLAKRLFIDHMLVCVLDGGSLKARWYSTRLGRYASPTLSLPRPGVGDLARPVGAAFAKVARAEQERARALADAADAKSRKKAPKQAKLWKKWYFWVAAAVVAGVVAAFAIKDSLTEEKVILRVTRP